MIRAFTMLMSRAGERLQHLPVGDPIGSPEANQGGGEHAGFEGNQEHWGRVAVAAIVLGLAVCGVWPASAESSQESGTGNMMFFKSGVTGLNSNHGGEFFTDCGLTPGPAAGMTAAAAGTPEQGSIS